MRALIEESWLKQPVWYKLYKTALVRDILFPKGKYHEDVFWSYQAVGRAKKVSVSDRIGYYYLQRGGSIMGEGYSVKRLDAIEAKEQRCAYMRKRFPALSALSIKDLWFTCIYQGQMALRDLDEKAGAQAMAFLRSVLKSNPVATDGCTWKEQIWLHMARLDLRMTCRLRMWLRIGL